MDKQVKNRVKKAMDKLSISAYAIAKSCSINERTIYEQTNGSSKIGTSVLAALLAYCPQLSAEWLLRGAGDMLISSVVPTERTPRDDRENTDQIVDANKKILEQIQELTAAQKEAYAAAINEKNDKIQELKYYVELQKDYIDGQKKTIEKLEQFIEHLKAENHELKKAQHTVTVAHAKSV